MIYHVYSSFGNTVGVDDYLGYFEIGDDGYCCRYLEIRGDGVALRYSTSHAADELGVLPEGPWDEEEGGKEEYGRLVPISRDLFEAVWSVTRCVNDSGGELPPRGSGR